MILSHSHRLNLFIEDNSECILCTLSVGLYGKGFSSHVDKFLILTFPQWTEQSNLQMQFFARRYIIHYLQYLHFN